MYIQPIDRTTPRSFDGPTEGVKPPDSEDISLFQNLVNNVGGELSAEGPATGVAGEAGGDATVTEHKPFNFTEEMRLAKMELESLKDKLERLEQQQASANGPLNLKDPGQQTIEQDSMVIDNTRSQNSVALQTGPQAEENTKPSGLDNAENKFKSEFTELSKDKAKFHNTMKTIYGDNYSQETAEKLRNDTLDGKFGWMPKTEIVSDDQMLGKNAAYRSDEKAIYINGKIQNDEEKMQKALSHEIGHRIDDLFGANKSEGGKPKDAKGDEGLLFQKILFKEIDLKDRSDIDDIKSINDHGKMIDENGKEVDVENWFGSSIADAVSDAAESVADTVKDVAKDVGKAAKDVAKGVVDTVKDVAKDVGKAAKDVAKEVADTVKDVAKGVSDAAKDQIKGTIDSLKWGGKAVKDATVTVADATADVAKDFADTDVGGYIVDQAEVIGDVAVDAAEFVGEKVIEQHIGSKLDLLEGAIDVGGDVGNYVGQELDDQLGDTAFGEAVKDVGGKIADGIDEAADVTGDLVQEGADLLDEGLDAAGQVISNQAEWVGETIVKPLVGEKDYESIKDAAGYLGDVAGGVKDSLMGTVNMGADAIDAALDDPNQAFEDGKKIFDKVTDDLAGTALKVGEGLVDTTGKALSGDGHAMGELLYEVLEDTLTGGAGKAGKAAKVADEVKDAVDDAGEAVAKDADDLVPNQPNSKTDADDTIDTPAQEPVAGATNRPTGDTDAGGTTDTLVKDPDGVANGKGEPTNDAMIPERKVIDLEQDPTTKVASDNLATKPGSEKSSWDDLSANGGKHDKLTFVGHGGKQVDGPTKFADKTPEQFADELAQSGMKSADSISLAGCDLGPEYGLKLFDALKKQGIEVDKITVRDTPVRVDADGKKLTTTPDGDIVHKGEKWEVSKDGAKQVGGDGVGVKTAPSNGASDDLLFGHNLNPFKPSNDPSKIILSKNEKGVNEVLDTAAGRFIGKQGSGPEAYQLWLKDDVHRKVKDRFGDTPESEVVADALNTHFALNSPYITAEKRGNLDLKLNDLLSYHQRGGIGPMPHTITPGEYDNFVNTLNFETHLSKLRHDPRLNTQGNLNAPDSYPKKFVDPDYLKNKGSLYYEKFIGSKGRNVSDTGRGVIPFVNIDHNAGKMIHAKKVKQAFENLANEQLNPILKDIVNNLARKHKGLELDHGVATATSGVTSFVPTPPGIKAATDIVGGVALNKLANKKYGESEKNLAQVRLDPKMPSSNLAHLDNTTAVLKHLSAPRKSEAELRKELGFDEYGPLSHFNQNQVNKVLQLEEDRLKLREELFGIGPDQATSPLSKSEVMEFLNEFSKRIKHGDVSPTELAASMFGDKDLLSLIHSLDPDLKEAEVVA